MSNLLIDKPVTLPKKYNDQAEYHQKKTDAVISMTEARLKRPLTDEERRVAGIAVTLERMCSFGESLTDEDIEKYYSNFAIERKTYSDNELKNIFSSPPYLSSDRW
jgi:hypothetical protein